MRKKHLIEQNAQLFSKLEDVKREIEGLNEALKLRENEINTLKAENEKLLSQNSEKPASPLEKLEKKVNENAAFNVESEYGAKVIGQLVMYAARICTELGTNPDNRERVSLVMGRLEVTKADILATLSSAENIDTKRITIDRLKKQTEDYFESIMAQ